MSWPALKRLALLTVVGTLGCSGTNQARTIQGERYREVEAPAPSAPRYATAPGAGDGVLGVTAVDVVTSAVEAASVDREMPLDADPRLAQLAQWIAERLGPNGEPPPNEVIEFFARHLGLVEPVPHTMVLGQPADTVGDGVRSSVGQFMARQTYNRWGAAVTERAGLTLVVVMLSWRWVELEPIPRSVEPGAVLEVRGRLLGDHENPTVVVAEPSGEIRRLPAGSGPAFDVRIPTEGAGVYRVEIVGRGPNGDTVIANFPVYVGEAVPQTVRLNEAGEGGGDVNSVRRALLSLINQTREEAGLPSVEAHDGLREVALAHSRDMVENDFIGHASPRTGTAAERVRAAGIQTGLVLENIGRGYGAAEIHRGLLESPGHRANLVNAQVSHVGIGVVAQPEGSRSAFVVTQVFIQQAQRVDLSGAPQRLLERINHARRARGAPEVSLEDPMSEAAREAAEAFFEDPSLSQQDTVDDASAALRRFAIAYSRIGGVMAVVADVSEAGALEPVLEAGIRFIGIGVAQGTRPDTGANAIAVVIVMAWPR